MNHAKDARCLMVMLLIQDSMKIGMNATNAKSGFMKHVQCLVGSLKKLADQLSLRVMNAHMVVSKLSNHLAG